MKNTRSYPLSNKSYFGTLVERRAVLTRSAPQRRARVLVRRRADALEGRGGRLDLGERVEEGGRRQQADR